MPIYIIVKLRPNNIGHIKADFTLVILRPVYICIGHIKADLHNGQIKAE